MEAPRSPSVLSLAVLASGTGTNLQAILDACASGLVKAKVAVVVSDKPTALALDRARKAGVDGIFVDPKGRTREGHETAVLDVLKQHAVGLVCLAGYMRILGPTLVRAFPQRIVNVHPALLPSFPGLHGQRQALEWGAKVTGCTTHFVDAEVDHGPIILQAAVPVLDDDTEDTLAKRILEQEHRIYPLTVHLFAEGRVRVEGRRVRVRPPISADEAQRFGLPGLAGGPG